MDDVACCEVENCFCLTFTAEGCAVVLACNMPCFDSTSHIAHLPETEVAAAANPDAFSDNDKHGETRRLPRSSRRG